MGFLSPEERARLVETQGPAAYERAMAEERRANTIKTVAGHDLRYVASRFGRLVAVGDSGAAFLTVEQAEAHARAHPVPISPKL
jgi:hypothetical protein